MLICNGELQFIFNIYNYYFFVISIDSSGEGERSFKQQIIEIFKGVLEHFAIYFMWIWIFVISNTYEFHHIFRLKMCYRFPIQVLNDIWFESLSKVCFVLQHLAISGSSVLVLALSSDLTILWIELGMVCNFCSWLVE